MTDIIKFENSKSLTELSSKQNTGIINIREAEKNAARLQFLLDHDGIFLNYGELFEEEHNLMVKNPRIIFAVESQAMEHMYSGPILYDEIGVGRSKLEALDNAMINMANPDFEPRVLD